MNLQRAVILAAAALLPFSAHPAGTTGLSSYLRQIPPPPRTAAEAYTACEVDDARVAGNSEQSAIEAPPFVARISRELPGEGVLAASQRAGPTPTMLGMGALGDAASAAAMADAIPGALSPDDQKVAVLLSARQDSSMARMDASLKAQSELSLLLRRLEAEHLKLTEEGTAALALIQNCPSRAVGPYLKTQRAYAEKHVDLVTRQLGDLHAAFDKRRVMAVDSAGFADQLAPLLVKAQGPMSRQGYSQARSDAVNDLHAMLSISDEAHRAAAYWQMIKRSLSKDLLCE